MRYYILIFFALFTFSSSRICAQSERPDLLPWKIEPSEKDLYLHLYFTFKGKNISWESERTKLLPGTLSYKFRYHNFAVLALGQEGDTLRYFMPSPLWVTTWTTEKVNQYRVHQGVFRVLLPFTGKIYEIILLDSGKEIYRIKPKEIADWIN